MSLPSGPQIAPVDAPRLWKIWVAIPAMLIVGAMSALAAGAAIWFIFGEPELATATWDSQAQLETARLALVIVGGIGGVVALVVTYRRQRVAEHADRRDHNKHFNDRFLATCAELGNAEATVRLAAVYAVARLADDWRTERQTCIDVLCAYLRMPYHPDSGQDGWKHGEREVRRSIISIMRNHLQISRGNPQTWQGYNFDFTEARFDAGDFSESNFTGGEVSFYNATFTGPVRFERAIFGATAVDFRLADFAAGTTRFDGAQFKQGTIDFSGATFSGGDVSFAEATFTGSTLRFTAATFTAGTVGLTAATFARGAVRFNYANFEGSTLDFSGSAFVGSAVNFAGATFSGGIVDLSQPSDYSVPATFDDVQTSDVLRLPRLASAPARANPVQSGQAISLDR